MLYFNTLTLRQTALLLAACSAASLIAVYVLQYGFGYPPCHLCLWQRGPYTAVLILVALSELRPAWIKHILWLCFAAFVIGSGIAFYHVGIEQRWFSSSSGCSGLPTGATLDDIKQAILNAPVIRCDDARFKLFGLSLPALNFTLSPLLAGFTLYTLRQHTQKP